MERIFCGHTGTNDYISKHHLEDLPLPDELRQALLSSYGAGLTLRPAQEAAFFQHDLINSRKNVLMTTPTNSGKSLVSYILAFLEAWQGKRAVLIEPLRALAQEKYDDILDLAKRIEQAGGPCLKVGISTGDYRLHDELMGDHAPLDSGNKINGEIIIATPERMDALSRVEDNLGWFKAISLVCVDEAHLIGDNHRGATLEFLLTFLRSLPKTPRLLLLSATLDNGSDLTDWLSPCVLIDQVPRYPTLEKWVLDLEPDEDISDSLIDEVKEILSQDGTSVMVFVYQTASAEVLATRLAGMDKGHGRNRPELEQVIEKGYAWYHSKMSAAARQMVRNGLQDGKIRVVVSTTALAMGVNLPTTHVLVRDITFPGAGVLDSSDVNQMIGRAGRGNNAGVGIVWRRPTDQVSLKELEEGLRQDKGIVVRSQLKLPPSKGFGRRRDQSNKEHLERINNQLIGILHRLGIVSRDRLVAFLGNSWGGQDLIDELDVYLTELQRWRLVYHDDEKDTWGLTALGLTGARYYIPPLTIANLGNLTRDLLSSDPGGHHLAQLNSIDLLFMLCLCSPRLTAPLRYSREMDNTVQAFMDALPLAEKSYLYRTWGETDPEALMGSSRPSLRLNDKQAEKMVVQMAYLTLFLYDLSQGTSSTVLKTRYRFDVEALEEGLRDTVLWLLSGFEKTLEIRNFYFHLKSNCEADSTQVHTVDLAFKRLSRLTFGLMPNLKYRSTLGELIRGIKRTYPNAKSYPGERTIQRLEEAGIRNMHDLVGKTQKDIMTIGVERRYADLIVGYLARRSM